jgi:PucR C-terminal helix-turn-helix domain
VALHAEGISIATRMNRRRTEFLRETVLRGDGRLRPGRPPARGLDFSEVWESMEAGFDFFLGALEAGDPESGEVPSLISGHIRSAAIAGVPLQALLYFWSTARSVLAVYLIEEQERAAVDQVTRLRLARILGSVFDRLLTAIVRAYEVGSAARGSVPRRELTAVMSLLAGAPVQELPGPYRLEGHHVAVVCGPSPEADLFDRLAKQLQAQLLTVHPAGVNSWSWLGFAKSVDSPSLRRTIDSLIPSGLPIAVGACETGVDGWRATHLQAKAAYRIAGRRGAAVHYEEVPLEASVVGDPLLRDFLRRRYLEPLKCGRAEGAGLLETLRAYFSLARNGASTSACLGVSRQTVINRLHTVEERIERPLASCGT